MRTNPEKTLLTLRKLFQSVSLRRTKDAVTDELQLTPRYDVTQEVQLNQNERRLYDVLKRSLSYFFRSPASDVDNNGSGSNILPTITRLRQFCDHGMDLLPLEKQHLFEECIDEVEMTRALITASRTCDSCDVQSSADDLSKIIFRAIWCGHTLCSRCLPERQLSDQSCPLCFDSEVSTCSSKDPREVRLISIHRKYQPSSKVSALLENLSGEQRLYPAVKRYLES